MNIRCVHCLKETKKPTSDHVFPSSWYPNTTSNKIQRWTVPSCSNCNNILGKQEKELFLRLALTTDPSKIEASGIAERAFNSLGIRAKNINNKEQLIREKHRQKIVNEIQTFVGPIIPIARINEPLAQSQRLVPVPIPGNLMILVYKKIICGCEYILGKKRYIEYPYDIEIYNGTVTNKFDELTNTLPFTNNAGPGFNIKRVTSTEDPLTVIYEIIIWGDKKILAIVLDKSKNNEI